MCLIVDVDAPNIVITGAMSAIIALIVNVKDV
jgi:hypothetical protein